jgi:hypothetical protein
VIELDNLARLAFREIERTSMLELCRHILGLHLQDKDVGQDYDYNEVPLPLRIRKNAALDGVVVRLVTETCLLRVSNPNSALREPPSDLTFGAQVKMWRGAGRRHILTGMVTFVGCGGPTTEVNMWGDIYVKKNKALVKVEQISMPNAKPKYLFANSSAPEENWNKEATFGSLFREKESLVVLVQTCTLDLVVSPDAHINTSLQCAHELLGPGVVVQSSNTMPHNNTAHQIAVHV